MVKLRYCDVKAYITEDCATDRLGNSRVVIRRRVQGSPEICDDSEVNFSFELLKGISKL